MISDSVSEAATGPMLMLRVLEGCPEGCPEERTPAPPRAETETLGRVGVTADARGKPCTESGHL